MERGSGMQVAVDLLSSLIAVNGQDKVTIHRGALQVAGDSLTEGWAEVELRELARRTTTKFRLGGQYNYSVTYNSEMETFLGMSRRARDEFIRRLRH